MEQHWLSEFTRSKSNVAALLESSEDEDQSPEWGGSRPGRAPNIERNREQGAAQLHNDYFSPVPVYTAKQFERRFPVTRLIFDRVLQGVCAEDTYFIQKQDCTGRNGLSAHQKVTAAFRYLAYGSSSDSLDEYIHLGESTTDECVRRFAKSVIAHFGQEYLRYPTVEDIKRVLSYCEKRGLPGMIGTIDCCKWEWKNCPMAWHGQYQGKEGVPCITLESIADDTLWIWHAFFGMSGNLNDINVLDASPLCNAIASGTYPPPVEYYVAGKNRNKPYWLADGIYPKWPLFLNTVSHPQNRKGELLKTCQESRRKDIERAFGLLKSKWHIVARPSRVWYKSVMGDIMRCCIILHNMMVEHRIRTNGLEDIPENDTGTVVGSEAQAF